HTGSKSDWSSDVCSSDLKKQKRIHTYSLDHTGIWMKTDGKTPENDMITKEMFKRIQSAIHELPPRCRLIYKLIKEDGLKYREARSEERRVGKELKTRQWK